MTAEELLKPRYKVIADYPLNPFTVGEVLLMTSEPDKRGYVLNNAPRNVNARFIKDYDKYPHLFKKLEWWENRKESEMLGYVKTAFGICKVVKHFVSKYSDIKTGQQCVIDDGQFERALYYNTLQPATEEEFNSQNKKEV